MLLKFDNLRCRLLEASSNELAWLERYLTFEDEKGRYSGNGLLKLYEPLSKSFPSGLLPLVRKAGKNKGFSIGVLDTRQKPVEPSAQDLPWLRDYQHDAVEAGLKHGRGVVQMATGGGKTEVMIGLAQRIKAKWLILVHRATLMRQTAQRYELRTGEQAGVLGDGEKRVRRVTVATFQTLAQGLGDVQLLEYLRSIQGVMIDEAHVLPADSFWRVLQRLPNAYYRYGVSATPLNRGDRKNVMVLAATGPLIYVLPASQLVAEGVLSRPKIKFVPVRQSVSGSNWHDVYVAGVVTSKVRNAAVVRVVNRAAKPCLVYVAQIDHGETLRKVLSLYHPGKVEFVWGRDNTQKRQAAIKRLRRRDISILVTSPIFDEGVDIPEVRSVVIATGGKSAIKALQRLGRGMRVAEDKSEVELWDFKDFGNKWLLRHSEARIRTYIKQAFDVQEVTTMSESLDFGSSQELLKNSAAG